MNESVNADGTAMILHNSHQQINDSNDDNTDNDTDDNKLETTTSCDIDKKTLHKLTTNFLSETLNLDVGHTSTTKANEG